MSSLQQYTAPYPNGSAFYIRFWIVPGLSVRSSHLIFQTRREVPADAVTASHQLLLKAGFIRPLGQGIYAALPLALRSLQKIERIIKKVLEIQGGLEVQLPFIQPTETLTDAFRWQPANSPGSVFKS